MWIGQILRLTLLGVQEDELNNIYLFVKTDKLMLDKVSTVRYNSLR